MRRIAIIPARGGSKRIPKKNIKGFLGKPIISYVIATVLNCGLFDEVMVSTDDDEIANISSKYGASIPFLRSAQNADDFATTQDVISEVLETYKSQKHLTFDYCCCIYPTAALITSNHLSSGWKLMREGRFANVVSVVPFSSPIDRALLRKNTGQTLFRHEENALKRSQDLPRYYRDAGQFYWINCSDFKKNPSLWNTSTGSIVMEEKEVQDIDNEGDWAIAELKYQLLSAT